MEKGELRILFFVLSIVTVQFVVVSVCAGQRLTQEHLGSFIGDTLDQYESAIYDFDFKIENFQWATFEMGRDSEVTAYVSYRKDTTNLTRRIQPFMKYPDFVGHIQKIENEYLAGDRDGAVFDVHTNDEIMRGQLISVRDSVILLSVDGNGPDEVYTIRRDNVRRMLITGESKMFSGMGYGAIAGASASLLVGSLSSGGKGSINDFGSTLLISAYIIIPPSVLIGGIIGAMNSTGEEEVDIHNTKHLKKYAKYPIEEPAYLEEMEY